MFLRKWNNNTTNEKNKIITLMRLLPIGSIIIVSSILIIIAIIGINKYFNDEMKKQENKIMYEEIYNSKKNIKNVYSLIKRADRLTKKTFKREIKTAVEVGYNLVSIIYKQNKNFPKEIIFQKIRDNLSEIRFYNDKSGYFFIYDLNGKVIMLPPKPSIEGKSLWNFKDIKGKYVIRNVVEQLKKGKKSIFEEWYYYKPNTNKIEKKLGYIKYFEPLNIFIGSAVYYDNIKKEIFKRITQVLSLQFTSNIKLHSNLMLLKKDGYVLYSRNRTLLGKNFYDEYKNIINTAIKNKRKIAKIKVNNQLLIFNYYKPLGITIIDTINLKELHSMILSKKQHINQVVSSLITQFLLIALIFIIIVLVITLKFSKLLENIFDVYEKKIIEEKEKAQKAAQVKSEFLANMSHEIRTPLNAMFGFIKILKEKEYDKESKRYLNIIEKSGESLLTIINDILDFSKIESGKLSIEQIEFNPKEEIEIIKELFEPKAKEKNILLEINDDLKYNIISDPTRLKQVISNLLSNAIKFTDKNKKIVVNIDYDESKERLYVEVIDEGIGIAQQKLLTIFEAFSQADNSTTRKYGGTGLGLTISYKLVKLLGGELRVESELNKGSRFYFSVPAKKTKIAKEIQVKEEKNIEHKFNFHILVVEDNVANQMFMKVILQKMGITFDIANNGLEAIEQYEKNKYDFILMDENMPKMSGIEATKKIRELEKQNGLKHTIIIALTANALVGDRERFINAGMDFYLSKPLDIEKLKEILDKF